MGVRYQAILKHLDEPYWCVDIGTSEANIINMAEKADRIIICTPTDTHFRFLSILLPIQKPILCEKPIVCSTKQVEEVLKIATLFKTHFSMMMQYAELIPYPHVKSGVSLYNYFRSGKDGLIWDCMQIIALANGSVELQNNSPIWKCIINGTELSSSDMDKAYLSFVRKWIEDKINQSHDDLLLFHRKTEELFNEHAKLLN